MRAPGSHLAAFRPISFRCLMTERGPGSSLILFTSECSTENVSTNNPIYQKLQTNCKHPTLLPLLLHIIVSRLVCRKTAESKVVSLSTSDILGANIRIQSDETFYEALRVKDISISDNL